MNTASGIIAVLTRGSLPLALPVATVHEDENTSPTVGLGLAFQFLVNASKLSTPLGPNFVDRSREPRFGLAESVQQVARVVRWSVSPAPPRRMRFCLSSSSARR